MQEMAASLYDSITAADLGICRGVEARGRARCTGQQRARDPGNVNPTRLTGQSRESSGAVATVASEPRTMRPQAFQAMWHPLALSLVPRCTSAIFQAQAAPPSSARDFRHGNGRCHQFSPLRLRLWAKWRSPSTTNLNFRRRGLLRPRGSDSVARVRRKDCAHVHRAPPLPVRP